MERPSRDIARWRVACRGLLAAVVSCLASAAAANDCPPPPPGVPRWVGGDIQEENDSPIKGDERYTQGLRIAIARHPDALWCRLTNVGTFLDGKLWKEGRDFIPQFMLLIGQNMYTPFIITSPVPDVNDRAFSGLLYAGGQLSYTSIEETERHTFEVYGGFRGKQSLTKHTQTDLHVLRTSRIPKGWGHVQPAGGVAVNALYRFDRRLLCEAGKPCYFDLVFGGTGELGSVRTAGGLHATARAGFNLSGFPAGPITNTAARRAGRPNWEAGATAGYDGRAIAHTSLVAGTEGTEDFEAKPLVGDFRWGGYLRYKAVRGTVLQVRRSPEFSIAGVDSPSQRFASISVTYEPDLSSGSNDDDSQRSWWFRDIEVELAMGGTVRGAGLDGGRKRGPAAHLAVRKGIRGGFSVGLIETGGTSVETAAPAGEDSRHTDLYLVQKAVTLGYKPRGPRGALAFRIGYPLYGQVAQLETIRNPRVNGRITEEIEDRDFKARRGWLAGIQYSKAVERHLAFGADVTYRRVSTAEVPGLEKPDFISVSAGIQVRP